MDTKFDKKGEADDNFIKHQKVPFITSPEFNEDDNKTCGASCINSIFPAGFCVQLKPMLKLTWPILIVQLTQFTFPSVALMFCGHLGKYELDAVALANTSITVTCITVIMGLLSACDTLFAQIFGSKNKKLAGVVLQRSLVIIALGLVPCFALLLNIEVILLKLGQDPRVSELTGDYVLNFMPSILFYFVYATVVKYLNSQNIVYPSMIIGIISCGSNILLHYVFLSKLKWGINGSAIAQDISYGIMAILNVSYLIISKVYEKTWAGWTFDCFQEWGVFCKLALSGLVMICFEWWAFEVGTILAGTLGTIELGAQSILFQYDVIYYMFPMAFSISTGIIVGQALGANDISTAITVARVGITCGSFLGAIAGILLMGLRNYLPQVFTDDQEVIDMTSSVLPVLGFYMTFSAIANVCSGVVRGLGQQHIGALVCIVNYGASVIGGVTWMLMTRKIVGFWFALAGMLLVTAVTYIIFICCVDWGKMAKQAQYRAKVIDKNKNEDRDEMIDPVEEKEIKKENQLSASGFDEIGIGSQALRDDIVVTARLSRRSLAIRRIPVILIFLMILIGSISFRLTYTVHHNYNSHYFEYLNHTLNDTQSYTTTVP